MLDIQYCPNNDALVKSRETPFFVIPACLRATHRQAKAGIQSFQVVTCPALLRYSRVETKGQEFRPAKLDDVVRDSVTDLEVAIQKIGARVEIGLLPTVKGDSSQLRQLFQNLIANAVKYHRPEGKTVIEIHGEERDGRARIFVEDNGIGFDEKYLDKMFQPFQRLHGRNEYPGIGMGLAICRKIVDRHGGTITAKSTPGKGSTFIVTLPFGA